VFYSREAATGKAQSPMSKRLVHRMTSNYNKADTDGPQHQTTGEISR